MLSIIVTSFKEPKTIAKVIKSILAQKLKEKYEILVIAPDKETLDITKKFKIVKTFQDPGKGKPTALNLAFNKAKGDILVLTDGDVFIKKDAIKNLLLYFKDKNVGAVTGHPVSLNPRNNIFGYWSHLLNDSAHLERLKRDKKNLFMFCSGYLFAMRSNIVKKIPADCLDDAYISALVWKKNYKIRYSPKSIVYIKNPNNLKDWIIQKRRNAIGHNRVKFYLGKIPRMKSLTNEFIYGWYKALSYPRTIKEFFWTLLLFPLRLYSWLISYYDKRKLMKLWERVETTK